MDIVKRRRIERVARERRAEEAQALANPELMRMAGQVKEVLPDVPLAVIARDLQETRSVDSTISRLVDGIVHYVPEKVRVIWLEYYIMFTHFKILPNK